MKFIGYNIFPICLLILAAYIIHLGRDGWGWCLLIAVLAAVRPTTEKSKD